MEPFIGQIDFFGGNFAPRGYAFCDGQLQAISSNDALFSLLGTIYGGDGRTTFGLPDARGRFLLQQGDGPGLPSYQIGGRGGAESMTLSASQMAPHVHAGGTIRLGTGNGTAAAGQGAYLASTAINEQLYTATAPAGKATRMGSVTTTPAGGGQSFSMRSPFQGVNVIIALFGIYPSRN